MRVITLGGQNAPQARTQPLMGTGHCSVRCMARSMAAHGTPQIFTYEFVHPTQEVTDEMNVGVPLITGPGNPFVPHASELEYVFAAVDRLNEKNGERDLARNMSAQWLHFASHGDPNQPGLPLWPQFSLKDDITMVLDVGPHGMQPSRRLYEQQCDFFDQQPNSVCHPSHPVHPPDSSAKTFYA